MLPFLWVIGDVHCYDDHIINVPIVDSFVIRNYDHAWSCLVKWCASVIATGCWIEMFVDWCFGRYWIPGGIAEDIIGEIDDWLTHE